MPGSVVIAAAGSVDHDQIVELAERTLGGAGGRRRRPAIEPAPADPAPTVRFQRKDTEQCHVCLGAVGLPRGDDRRFASRVLDAIFGGLSSSRLFQAVREERGLAYSVYSFAGQYADTGQIGLYVGTRPDKIGEAMDVVGDELARLREQPATEEELERARENVKARVMLALESTGARMNRLGASLLFGLPLLETDEVMARFDAVTLDDLRELTDELWAPERLSRRRHRPRRAGLPGRRRRRLPGRRRRGMIRVAVAGAAGPHGADGLRHRRRPPTTWRSRAAPTRSLGTAVADVLGDADVLVDFTRPDTALDNARAALEAGVHVVIGTSGFDLDGLRAAAATSRAKAFFAPNFAIGAVLMMKFAAEASRRHGARRDHRAAPSGQARRAVRHRRAHRRDDGGRRADPLGPPARASSPTRRSSSATSRRR